MQEWVKSTGAKVCIVFEGRDTAGKGGTIKRDHRAGQPPGVPGGGAAGADRAGEVADVHPALHRRTSRPAGEVVIFDRSWYNRAGVERVMGFCTEEQTERFLEQVPAVEKAMVDSGILLLKYWLEVSPDEQTRRLESRIHDPRKIWKLSDMDLKSYSRWYDYSRARDAMFARDRHRLGAVVRRAHRRQEARPAQHHQPPAQPGPLRAADPRTTGELPKRQKPGGLPRARRCRCVTSPHRSDEEGAAAPVSRSLGVSHLVGTAVAGFVGTVVGMSYTK